MNEVPEAKIVRPKFYEERMTPEVAELYEVELDKLRMYCKRMRDRSEREAFAEAVGTTFNHLTQIYYGNRPCSMIYAVNIDRLTKGQVSMTGLLPDVDWRHVKARMKGKAKAA